MNFTTKHLNLHAIPSADTPRTSDVSSVNSAKSAASPKNHAGTDETAVPAHPPAVHQAHRHRHLHPRHQLTLTQAHALHSAAIVAVAQRQLTHVLILVLILTHLMDTTMQRTASAGIRDLVYAMASVCPCRSHTVLPAEEVGQEAVAQPSPLAQ